MLGAMSPRNLDNSSVYSPLGASTHQIRLLALAPSKNDIDDITCCLNVVGLHGFPIPNYDALSYVWGDPSPRFTMVMPSR